MSFCPNCGTKLDEGAMFCGECGTQIDAIQDSTEESTSWEQDVNDETEGMPWDQDVNDETETMPWEQDVNDETETMPWEQGVNDETETMPWEQGVNDEMETMPWEQGSGMYEEPSEEEGQTSSGYGSGQNGPMRPSQIKRARQKKTQTTDSTITFKKPNINVKDYKDKAKKLSKTQIIVIAEVLCLILVIAAFCGIGSSKSSAQAVAKEYVQAYADQNWSKLYDLTDFPEGAYLQKSQFIECMSNAETVSIDNFEISEMSSSSGYGSNSLFGYSDESSLSLSGIQKFYNVQYTVKGQGSGTMALELIKQSEKSMLFFDTWKVGSDDLVISNYCISVPIGASVTIDGIALAETDKMAEHSYGVDEYSISIFSGTHKIQVAMPWFQIYEDQFYAYEGDGYYAYNMELTEDGELALQAKMQEALEKFYQAAVAGKGFSEISDLIMEDYQESAEESYEYFVEELCGSDYYTLNEVTFDEFDCDFYISDGTINAEMRYDYDMNYTYTRSSWLSNKKTTETKTEEGISYLSASFGYDGESYKLISINIRSIW